MQHISPLISSHFIQVRRDQCHELPFTFVCRYGANIAKLYISTVITTFILLLVFLPFTLIWYLNLPVALAGLFGKVMWINALQYLNEIFIELHCQAQQSWSLHVSRDAGVLSLSSAVMGAAAVTVRSFTFIVLYTETELDKRDPIGLVITAIMAILHYIIAYQVFLYSEPELIKKKEI